VSDECLEEVRHSLLCIIVPNFEEVILSTSEHVAAIEGQVSACDSALMDSVKFAKVCSFKSGEAVDSDALVLCHNDDLFVVLGELETADDVTNLDLVL